MTRILTLLLLVASAGLVAGCGIGGAPGEARSITVVLDWTPNTNHTGVYLAQRDGLYRDAGLDVEIIEPDQSGALGQLGAGNAEFAFTYAEQLLPARAQGTPAVSIATVLRTNTSSLVAPANRGIQRPKDLAGKTYGTYGGEIERPLLEALVRCDGGDPSRVSFVEVGNADYAVGFRKRAYDAVWVFDGWDVIRLRDLQGTAVTTIPFREHLDCIPDWYTPILATTEATLRSDPDLVRAFLDATAEGYRRAASDPQDAADALLSAVPEADRDLVERSARFLAPFYAVAGSGWGRQDPAVWRRFAQFLTDSGILPSSVDSSRAFTNDFLPSP